MVEFRNEEIEPSQHPIFIGGLMKSGTSLMRKLISLSPDVFGGLETHWFSGSFGGDESKKKLSIFYELSEADQQAVWGPETSNEGILSRLMSLCAKREKKGRWVEKTPDNIFHAPRIWGYWPTATLIRVRRDPLDVFASWKKNKGSHVSDFIQIALNERRSVAEIASDSRYLEVGYEDLVSTPQETINTVFKHLQGAAIPDVSLFNGDDMDARRIQAATGKISATAASLAKPVFSSSIGAWHSSLSPQEVHAIQAEL